MWEQNDLNNFNKLIKENKGQISNDKLSSIIYQLSSNRNIKTYLEIGTWNGLGSTKAFVDGFKKRTDDYIFYSLECNKDKSLFAKNLYKNNNKINILNEIIWNEIPDNFYKIFPQCLSNKKYKQWNDVDIINMKKCNKFLDRIDLPKIFDVILLDGGEFTTYHEFQLLKDRCRLLLLDDTNTDKCKLIVKEIKENKQWKILKEDINERNGFLIAQKL